MLLKHSFQPDQVLVIEPLQDKNFPRHSAFMSVRNKDRAIYSAIMDTQAHAIEYAKRFGYIVPFGF